MTHLLNFQSRFVAAVESGEKRQTLRQPRKRPIRVGDELRLYTGLRTKSARLLRVVRVSQIVEVEMHAQGVTVNPGPEPHECAPKFLAKLAKADGFSSWQEMKEWFRAQYGLPVRLDVIRWEEEWP